MSRGRAVRRPGLGEGGGASAGASERRGGEGGRAREGVHMQATAPNVRVYLGVGLKGCIGPAHLLVALLFSLRGRAHKV